MYLHGISNNLYFSSLPKPLGLPGMEKLFMTEVFVQELLISLETKFKPQMMLKLLLLLQDKRDSLTITEI